MPKEHPHIVYNFGREEKVDKEALRRLPRSIGRFLSPEGTLQAEGEVDTPGLRHLYSNCIGPWTSCRSTRNRYSGKCMLP